MKFRKKPVVIEAIRWTGENLNEAAREFRDMGYIATDLPRLAVITLEGVMIAQPGDWIIKGVAGEFYPCKPEIFELTYERVE